MLSTVRNLALQVILTQIHNIDLAVVRDSLPEELDGLSEDLLKAVKAQILHEIGTIDIAITWPAKPAAAKATVTATSTETVADGDTYCTCCSKETPNVAQDHDDMEGDQCQEPETVCRQCGSCKHCNQFVEVA